MLGKDYSYIHNSRMENLTHCYDPILHRCLRSPHAAHSHPRSCGMLPRDIRLFQLHVCVQRDAQNPQLTARRSVESGVLLQCIKAAVGTRQKTGCAYILFRRRRICFHLRPSLSHHLPWMSRAIGEHVASDPWGHAYGNRNTHPAGR